MQCHGADLLFTGTIIEYENLKPADTLRGQLCSVLGRSFPLTGHLCADRVGLNGQRIRRALLLQTSHHALV